MSNKFNFKWTGDDYYARDYNWDRRIAETCIITIPNHARSQGSGLVCMRSCLTVGQANPSIYLGYDGTNMEEIRTPEHLKSPNNPVNWVKVVDSSLSITEVACALSHISLWVHCININKPIVIMEHDAYMLRPFERMTYTNSVEYLGRDSELITLLKDAKVDSYHELIQYYKETGNYPQKVIRLPVTMVINYNFLFSHGLHAYAIDPFMARRLFARVLTEGLINPIDVVVEVTDFELVQTAVYAILGPKSVESTISPTYNRSERKDTYSVPGVSQ